MSSAASDGQLDWPQVKLNDDIPRYLIRYGFAFRRHSPPIGSKPVIRFWWDDMPQSAEGMDGSGLRAVENCLERLISSCPNDPSV